MKRILLATVVIALTHVNSYSQCTPDPVYANALFGFYPDSLTFLADGSATGGQDYSAVIDLRTVADTLVYVPPYEVTVYMDAFKIIGLTGLPGGFSYEEAGPTFNPVDDIWYNNYGTPGVWTTLSAVQGCLAIAASGAAVSAVAPVSGHTDHPLVITLDYRIAATDPDMSAVIPNGSWISTLPSFGPPLITDDFVIRVYADGTPVGIYSNVRPEGRIEVYPNPGPGIFHLLTEDVEGAVSLTVTDVRGREVWNSTYTAKGGHREVIDLSGRPKGMYMLHFVSSKGPVSKKLILD